MELTTSYQMIDQKFVVYSKGNLYIRVYAKYSEQDIANNRTKVQYQARGYYDGAYYIYDIGSRGYVSGTSASQVNYTRRENYPSGETTLATTEGWVTHNADGTMSVTATAYMNLPNFGEEATATGVATLPTLHTPPTINTATMTELSTTLLALSVPDTTVVRYLSKKKIVLNGTANDDATINGYRLEHFNTTYNIPASGYQSSNTFNTDYTNHNISITDNKANIVQKMKDSLNGESTDWVYVDVSGTIQKPNAIAYTKPSIEQTSTNIRRKSGGGVNLTDNKASLNIKATYYKASDVIGNNNNIQQIGYKIWEKGASEPSSYTSVTPTTSGGNITVTDFIINNINYTKTYNYKIIVKDRFGYQDIAEGVVATGRALWTEFEDSVNFLNLTIAYNPIIETGSNTEGSWIKYYDGTMICNKVVSGNTGSAFSLWEGNIYYFDIDNGDWPQEFTTFTLMQATSHKTQHWLCTTGATTTSAGTTRLLRPSDASSSSGLRDYEIFLTAFGRWK